MRPGELIPSDETLTACAVPSRMAYAVMLQTKEELIKMHGTVDHEHVDQMMAQLTQSAETLKGITCMLETAYLRLLASASAHLVRKGKFVIDGKLQRARA